MSAANEAKPQIGSMLAKRMAMTTSLLTDKASLDSD
jgi:hypothetical protein